MSKDKLDQIILKIKQAYTQAHSDLGGSLESTVEQRWEREAEIIAEAKKAILDWIEEAIENTVREIYFEKEKHKDLKEYMEQTVKIRNQLRAELRKKLGIK